MNTNTKVAIIAIASIIVTACNNNPKVITSTAANKDSNTSSGIFSETTSTKSDVDFNSTTNNDLHTVIVNEVLPAAKYTYLNVNEGDDVFWIATRSKAVKIGETYYYKGGLLKTNFESKEHKRVFDKIYLISNLVASNHSKNSDIVSTNGYLEKKQKNVIQDTILTQTQRIVEHEGSIKIAELVKDPKKFEGKTVQISGVCTKINAGIMDRNWLHIKDGSKDDYDLVITLDEFIPEGSSVTIKAIVVLNKDFGAGYIYDLILENGTIVR